MRVAAICFALLAVLVSGAAAAPLTSSFSAGLLGVLSGKPKLIFGAKKTFKIVSFSDMHFGEGEDVDWGPQQDVNTSHVHSVVLDNERPDFVVFNGDLLTGENLFKENATKYLDQVWAPTVERNIPFASTHGNHDNSFNITHEEEINYEIAQHGKTLSYTRSDVGPRPYGLGNYWVPVYTKASDVKPAVILWFFDSRSFVTGEAGPVPAAADYYWVDENTVPTYIEEQSALMKRVWGSLPRALVFVHIPVQKADDLAPLPSAGDHDDEPDPSAQGFLNNVYTGLDLPFWNAVVSHLNGGPYGGNVLAVTSGHDHGESWCARSTDSSGIPICFNGHSGYGGYATTHSQVRNGRAFELKLSDLVKKSPTVRSWNSYEDCTTNEHVILGPHYMPQYNDVAR
ncbi:unnamed protein product [Mycena citricolor]|uniref:Calcineurin-like phosphoesterase domain-containing protein n=1 Tax=Mycena citricolor TaxID=2018698 RepID=A0AAD2HZP2_9AGAR|nr:unnamed protein product [Mycena citricolor]